MTQLALDAEIEIDRVGRFELVVEAVGNREGRRVGRREDTLSGRGRKELTVKWNIVVTRKPRVGRRTGCQRILKGAREAKGGRIEGANDGLPEQVVVDASAGANGA